MGADGTMNVNALECAPIEIHLEPNVLAAVDDHVHEDTRLEYGGVLVGSVARDGKCVLVTGAIRATGAVSEVASLTFTHETWDAVNDVLDHQFPGEQMV